jgi:hypothetical protein
MFMPGFAFGADAEAPVVFAGSSDCILLAMEGEGRFCLRITSYKKQKRLESAKPSR